MRCRHSDAERDAWGDGGNACDADADAADRYRRFSVRMFVVAIVASVALAAAAYGARQPGPARVIRPRKLRQYRARQHRIISWRAFEDLARRYAVLRQSSLDRRRSGAVRPHSRATPFCQKQPKSLSCIAEHAHNDIVEAASTTGIPGLLTMLGLFLVPAELFRRALIACRGSHHQQGVSLGGAGLGVVMTSLISGLTQVTMAHQANVVFYAGLIGLLLGMAGREARSASADGA
jgi:O-antigen ligase